MVHCRVAPIESLPVHHHSANYLFSGSREALNLFAVILKIELSSSLLVNEEIQLSRIYHFRFFGVKFAPKASDNLELIRCWPGRGLQYKNCTQCQIIYGKNE